MDKVDRATNQSFKAIENELKTKEAIKEFQENFESFILSMNEMAKIKKACYDAHINAGFNENQALILTDLQFRQGA